MLHNKATNWRNPPPANPHTIVSDTFASVGTVRAYMEVMSANETTRLVRTEDDWLCYSCGADLPSQGVPLLSSTSEELGYGHQVAGYEDIRYDSYRCPTCGRLHEIELD
jgi:hypothetical protein